MDKKNSVKKFSKKLPSVSKSFPLALNNLPPDAQSFIDSPFDRQCWLAGIIHGGMSRTEALEKVCETLLVSESTAKRWLSGRAQPHPCAVLYLLAHYRGVPPGKDWTGWRFVGNALVSPNGESITPEIHRRLYWLTNEIRIMRDETGTARAKVRMLESIGAADRLDKVRLASKLLSEVMSVGV
ncbi:DUF3653 domain-containing protein [Bowmanella yangjiangensis]|uniref:Transcriptional regulator n=1 Tax=Bowmanella yangjiangensis TaxID=2811230 RepID=A0ABS3CTT8_9ALTE|nr:DUF3653 domain-containing protein [Bowmanella yangjiangensis]MBN7820536.1 hypothetical protein [Bowmanella yangjiangensis]